MLPHGLNSVVGSFLILGGNQYFAHVIGKIFCLGSDISAGIKLDGKKPLDSMSLTVE